MAKTIVGQAEKQIYAKICQTYEKIIQIFEKIVQIKKFVNWLNEVY